MTKRVRDIFKIGQKGFTLIELMAVMAILAVLVAVVAPSVTGQKDASVNAQVLQDATQVRSAASKFFASINESEVRTPHTITTVTLVASTASTAAQVVSNKWPERFITLGTTPTPPANVTAIGAGYSEVFQTSAAVTVHSVVLLDKTGTAMASTPAFINRFNAINIDALLAAKLMEKGPSGTETKSEGMPNFLWLLEKTSSSAAPEAADDNRSVAVFKLVKVVKKETAGTAGGTLELTYKQIF